MSWNLEDQERVWRACRDLGYEGAMEVLGAFWWGGYSQGKEEAVEASTPGWARPANFSEKPIYLVKKEQ